jgi:hypothetical protein
MLGRCLKHSHSIWLLGASFLGHFDELRSVNEVRETQNGCGCQDEFRHRWKSWGRKESLEGS